MLYGFRSNFNKVALLIGGILHSLDSSNNRHVRQCISQSEQLTVLLFWQSIKILYVRKEAAAAIEAHRVYVGISDFGQYLGS